MANVSVQHGLIKKKKLNRCNKSYKMLITIALRCGKDLNNHNYASYFRQESDIIMKEVLKYGFH